MSKLEVKSELECLRESQDRIDQLIDSHIKELFIMNLCFFVYGVCLGYFIAGIL